MTRPLSASGCRGLGFLAVWLLSLVSLHAAPLRVLVASDSAAVRDHYAAALQQGGADVTRAPLPEAAQLAAADVLLLHRSQLEPLPAAARQAISEFARRGGGVVAVHGAVAAGDAAWGKALLGGAWDPAASAKFRSVMMLSVRPEAHPIVQDAAQFDVEDDTLYDLSLADNLTVLGAAFTPKVTRAGRRQQADRASIYDIQPQLWAFEGPQHRAVVLLQGAEGTLKHASIRTFLLRGVAWAGRRGNVDELCAQADLASLRYPVGGPRPADETVRQFELQPGFRATVVATEPLINKPIAIAWDARGRLWVAETPEYPNGRRPLTAPSWKEGGVLEPGKYDRPARDRISILEDTDGDGRMDRKTVFHEGLELITGFCMHRDGVIVVAQPNVVWLRDTNGDDKADQEQPVFGGFTPGDTHFVANHFIPAPDGWIYASTGSGATATKPGTKETVGRVSSGLFRFKADGSAIEQVGSSGGNTFGADVTSDLELFHGKATSGNPLQHVVLPEWVLAKAGTTSARAMQNINPGRTVARQDLPDRAPLMQIDQVGRYSAACASLVAEGGAWPAEYRDTIFVTEPILDIIHHERLVPKGPTLAGELVLQKGEWLRSRDYWFTPVTLAWGPDGAMYVLDFYTPVVAHNDTRGPQHSRSGASVRPDREHYYGRIYRIQHEAAPRLAHPDLTRADGAGLVAAFRHPNRTVRFNALRVLVEKADTLGAAAGPALRTMALGEKFVPARLQALWALQRLGRLDADVFASALRAEEPAVRKNALLIAEAARRPLTAAEVSAALEDRDERVRLTALRAMTAAPGSMEATEVLLARQPKFEDPWSKAAASAAAAANPGLLLGQVLAKGEGQEDFARSLAASVAGANDGSAGRVVVAAAQSRNAKLAAAVVDELGRRPPAAPADRPPALAALGRMLASTDADLALSALPLAVAWDADGSLRPAVTKVTSSWLAVAQDASQPAARRSQAVRAVLSARAADPAVLPALLVLADRPQPEAFRRELIAGLAATGDPAVGRAWVASFAGWPTAVRGLAFDALASRPAWAALVLDALDTGKLSPAVLSPLQASRLTAHPDPALAARAKALLARLGSGANPAKDEILARLRPEVEKPGNAANGKAVFAANCASCHRLAGQGYELGPDLDGIGSHPAAELLVHIVDPNRMVDDEHRTWNITLKDGTQHSALIAGENAATVRLRMAAGVALDVPVADIVRRDKSPNSLMPEGLEALGGPALCDVIAYIRGFAPGAEAPVVMTGTAEGGQVVPVSAIRGELRPLSLAGACTADTRRGLYASTNAVADTFPFVKFGRVTANGVPFEIVDPARSADGRNVIVLRGGPEGSFARTLPRRVEIPVGLAASRLHFLGGVAGWGGGPGGNTPVMKVTLHYAGGQTQVAELRAGREFVDYIRRMDVPGSQYAEGVVREKQVRTFAVPVRQPGVIEKVVLESAGNRPAPTTVAITAELRGP